MKKAILLPWTFDSAALLAEITAFTKEAFMESPSSYTAPGKIWALNLVEPPANLYQSQGEFNMVPTPELDRSPNLKAVLAHFQAPCLLYRVHLVNPDGYIQTHRDAGRSFAQGVVRIHVPVITDPEFYFFYEDQGQSERVIMQPGECWYLNVHEAHRLEHKGTQDRIHLVLDFKVNAWWEGVFGPQVEKAVTYSAEDEAWIAESLKKLGYLGEG